MKVNAWDSVPQSVSDELITLGAARDFSRNNLDAIRKDMAASMDISSDRHVVIIAGSLGRQEAHAGSDVDAFILSEEPAESNESKDILSKLKLTVESPTIGLKMAKSTGAFAVQCQLDQLINNIGGNDDTNQSLTQRILILVEGVGLDEKAGLEARNKILSRYLYDLQDNDDRRAVFLLNDVIRYYRTICVDYEYKKTETDKAWAVRLMKLRHSRKLLYFSALLPLLESMHLDKDRAAWLISQFTELTALERIVLLLAKYGDSGHWEILERYDTFLALMQDDEKRQSLDEVDFDERESHPVYQELRKNAHEFGEALLNFILHVEPWQESLSKYVIS